MVNNRLSLLVEDEYLTGQFTHIAAKLQKLLPGLNVGAFVSEVSWYEILVTVPSINSMHQGHVVLVHPC